MNPTCAIGVEGLGSWVEGVDLSDALIKYFSVTRKTKQCYMKLFLYFIDIAVVNSFIISMMEMAEAKNQKPLDKKSFRMQRSPWEGSPSCLSPFQS